MTPLRISPPQQDRRGASGAAASREDSQATLRRRAPLEMSLSRYAGVSRDGGRTWRMRRVGAYQSSQPSRCAIKPISVSSPEVSDLPRRPVSWQPISISAFRKTSVRPVIPAPGGGSAEGGISIIFLLAEIADGQRIGIALLEIVWTGSRVFKIRRNATADDSRAWMSVEEFHAARRPIAFHNVFIFDIREDSTFLPRWRRAGRA